MVAGRYETELPFQNKVSLYGLAGAGLIYAKAPSVGLNDAGTDVDVSYVMGGGFVLDRILDISVRYNYAEINFTNGYGELPQGNRQRVENLTINLALRLF
jgi:hypothetical protein